MSKIALSTSSVYPEGTAAGFELAASLGYDGVEIMVGTDAASQDSVALRQLVQHYQLPILAIHAPCLLVTQRVWGTNPWGKLTKARDVAELLGAKTVVVHPPFRWQRSYARDFVTGLQRMQQDTDIAFAVENMYPWRAPGAELAAYSPSWDIADTDYPITTLDVSHAAVARTSSLDLAQRLGDRLGHLHLADGTDSARDEHLIPGLGQQPVHHLMEHLLTTGFDGTVVLEVSTRSAADRATRADDLAAALAFARHYVPAA